MSKALLVFASLFFISKAEASDLFPTIKERCVAELKNLGKNNQLPVSYRDMGYPSLQSDHKTVLDAGPLVTVPKDKFFKVMAAITIGERNIFRVVIGNTEQHKSVTHSYEDVGVQAMSVIGHLENSHLQQLVTATIYGLHWLDDLADQSSSQDLLSLDIEDKEFLIKAYKILASRYLFFPFTVALLEKLAKSLLHYSQFHKTLFLEGVTNMLRGAILFSNHNIKPHDQWLHYALNQRNQFSNGSTMYHLITRLHPLFTILGIRPLWEVIDAIIEERPNPKLIRLKNLFLGPVVYHHDNDKEVDKENMIESYEHLSLKRIHGDLEEVAQVIKKLPSKEKRRVLKSIPAIVEVFASKLYHNYLLGFYLEFLMDKEIVPFLPIDLNQMMRLLDKMEQKGYISKTERAQVLKHFSPASILLLE